MAIQCVTRCKELHRLQEFLFYFHASILAWLVGQRLSNLKINFRAILGSKRELLGQSTVILTQVTYLTLARLWRLLSSRPSLWRAMPELRQITHDTPGVSIVHRSLAELMAGLQALPGAPRDAGRLAFIVCRHAPGMHEALARVRLTPQEGVPGDEWNRRPPLNPEAQLTVIRRDVAELIAHGQSLTVSGDNLLVDLDISAANLPVGTRLRVGEAVVEMSPKPHNGCAKFQNRFGQDAFRFVQAPETRAQNLRGVYWRVVEPGEVTAGAPIQVLSRPNHHA